MTCDHRLPLNRECDDCAWEAEFTEAESRRRCANTVSSGNGIGAPTPDPLREEALAVVMNEHRKCGPKFDGCYSHFPWTTHCRADGMTWPCDVDRIRAALAPTPDPLLDALDEAEDFNERSHQGQFYVGWKRAIKHLRAALASEEER